MGIQCSGLYMYHQYTHCVDAIFFCSFVALPGIAETFSWQVNCSMPEARSEPAAAVLAPPRRSRASASQPTAQLTLQPEDIQLSSEEPALRWLPHRIPRRLWVLWAGLPVPELPAACFATMRATNPQWYFTIIDPQNSSSLRSLGLHPPPVANGSQITVERLSDWYRLEVLARHGGVYMDSNNVNFRPLEDWVDLSSEAVQGFHHPGMEGPNTTLESWAIAAPANSPFMARWRDNFGDSLRVGPSEWYNLQSENLTAGMTNYLNVEVAWRKTRYELSRETYPTSILPCFGPGGPYTYQTWGLYPWTPFWTSLDALTVSMPPPLKPYFFKFRGPERWCTTGLSTCTR